MKKDLLVFKEKLLHIQSLINEAEPLANKLREYYKHQSTEMDSYSESMIISFQYLKDIECLIDDVNDLIGTYDE